MLADRPDAGSLLGLGLGFVVMATARYECSEQAGGGAQRLVLHRLRVDGEGLR